MLEGLQDGSIETGVLGQDIMQDPLRRCLLLGRLRFLFFSCTKIAAPIVGNSRGLTPSIDGRSSLVFNMTNDSIAELFQRPDPRVSHRVNFVHHKLCRASKAGSILEDLESVSVDCGRFFVATEPVGAESTPGPLGLRKWPNQALELVPTEQSIHNYN